jgi:hypothetical protein
MLNTYTCPKPTDVRIEQTKWETIFVGSNSANWDQSAETNYRTIGVGAPRDGYEAYYCGNDAFQSSGAYKIGALPAGNLKMAPWGLGHLLKGGQLPDARTFYCPSGGKASQLNGQYYDTMLFPQQPEDWQMAGGFSGQILTHGNWPMRGYGGWGTTQAYGVQTSYCYRNQALTGDRSAQWAYDYADSFTIPYTRPGVTSEYDAPMFKTQRRLQSRALVSDGFTKIGCAAGTAWTWDTNPGFGALVHEDGYNVLYGDYSVQWNGDPEQRIIYWNLPNDGDIYPADKVEFIDPLSKSAYTVGAGYFTETNRRISYMKGSGECILRFAARNTAKGYGGTGWVRADVLNYDDGGGYFPGPAFVLGESAPVWHTFDTLNNQDVGVIFSPPNGNFPNAEMKSNIAPTGTGNAAYLLSWWGYVLTP